LLYCCSTWLHPHCRFALPFPTFPESGFDGAMADFCFCSLESLKEGRVCGLYTATSLFTDLLSRVDWCWNVCMMYVCVHVWREVFRGHRVQGPPSSPTHARGIRTAGGGRAPVDGVSKRRVPSITGTTSDHYKVHSQRGRDFLILSLGSASCVSSILAGGASSIA